MKTEEQIKAKLKELNEEISASSETGAMESILEWVLEIELQNIELALKDGFNFGDKLN